MGRRPKLKKDGVSFSRVRKGKAPKSCQELEKLLEEWKVSVLGGGNPGKIESPNSWLGLKGTEKKPNSFCPT